MSKDIDLYQTVFDKGIRAFKQKRYGFSANCFSAAVNFLEGEMNDELFMRAKMSHKYRNYKVRADWLFGQGFYEDALSDYKDLLFEEGEPEIKERIEVCERKAILPFEKDGLCGFKRGDGVTVIEPQFDLDAFFRQDRAVVVKDWKYGIIDREGHTIIPFDYDFIAPRFEHDLTTIKKDKKSAYINRHGEIVIDYIYEETGLFFEGLAAVKKKNKWGYIDPSGKVIIDFHFDDTCGFVEGLASAKINGKWGFINTEGKVIIDCIYEEPGSFSENWACVKLNGKYGYISPDGQVGDGIEFKYDNGYDFSMGMAIVKIKSDYFYINRNGRIIGDANFMKELLNPTK